MSRYRNPRMGVADEEVDSFVESERLFGISKEMVNILRHGKGRFPMRSDGFLQVSQIVQERRLEFFAATEADVLNIVENADKQRFKLVRDDRGLLWIRCIQGHSADFV